MYSFYYKIDIKYTNINIFDILITMDNEYNYKIQNVKKTKTNTTTTSYNKLNNDFMEKWYLSIKYDVKLL